MVSVIRVDLVTLFFKTFGSHKNGIVELFKFILLNVYTQLFKTADNSDNVLKHYFSSRP